MYGANNVVFLKEKLLWKWFLQSGIIYLTFGQTHVTQMFENRSTNISLREV